MVPTFLYLQFSIYFLGHALPLLPKAPSALHAETLGSEQGAAANEAALVQLPSKRRHGLDVSDVAEDNEMIDKIVYIKTESTGSSTLTSILHWFCENHDRRCFIYPDYLPEIGNGKLIWRPQLTQIVAEEAGTLDIWPQHARLETDLFDELIPGNFKISLFREPFSRLMSTFRHCEGECILDMALDHVQRVLDALQNDTVPTNCCPQRFKMSFQVPIEKFHELDFILLTDEYDLGLMMLKRVLGWSVRDMLYRRMKSEHDDSLVQAVDQLQSFLQNTSTPAIDEFLSECSGGDEIAVYDLARTAFDHQWNSFSAQEQKEINADLEMFQAALAALEECCDRHIDDVLCHHMAIDSVQWTLMARESVDDDGIVRFVGGAGSVCMSVIDAQLSHNATVNQSLA